MLARIYRPAKNAMQSGKGKSKQWVLEFEPELAPKIDPLMGWTSSADTAKQVRINFESKEEAIAFAKAKGIPHRVTEPHEAARVIKSYGENFAFGRKRPWTH
jgi:hypothetical protein